MNKKAKLGRRPVADKKEAVAIYIKKSEINGFGGKEMVRAFLESKWLRRATAKSSLK